MITAGDEYPIHQTPEPIAFAGSDRNFYDRFFFNGYSPDGSVFFAAALGVYPHLNIMDGAVSILKNGVQSSIHVSRLLNMQRMDTQVGPLRIAVREPLKQIALCLELTQGIGLDLTFTGRHFPIEEPRFTYRQGPRMLIDCTRMTQNGRWQGRLNLDGESLDVADFYGTRDRSWGVRPIGDRDTQPVLPQQVPQFYWLWAPINFPNRSLYFHVNEDATGGAWNTRSMLAEEAGDRHGLIHLNRPEMQVTWQSGTRRVGAAALRFEDGQGRTHRVHYTPVATFMMKGIGYGHAEKGHGRYRGDLVVEREDLIPGELNWQQPDNLHIQAIVKALHLEPDGRRTEGIGILEQLCLGPHARHGWQDILDAP